MKQRQSGFVLVWTLIFIGTFLSIAVAYASFAYTHLASARRTSTTLNALAVAESGADAFMYNVNVDTDYAGTDGASGTANTCSNAPAPVTLYSNTIQGKATYSTCIIPGVITNEKIVTSIGKIYYPSTATIPTVTRKIKLVIKGSMSAGYTTYSGPGGLNVGSNVNITNGPIYVGGKLHLNNNAIIGSVAKPLTIYVDDDACPSPATSSFPQHCGNGQGVPGYSIQVDNGSHIYGSTYAANTINNLTRLTNPGFVSSTIPAYSPLNFDHDNMVTSITSAQSATNADCSGGPSKTWSANTKWTGNVTIGNNCNVTINGDILISGNLSLSNNATVTPAAGLATAPKIIIDGSIGLTTGNNSAFLPNSGGIGFNVYTFYSRNAADTGDNGCSPSCATVTGVELSKSQNWTTINLGNNFSGANSSIFYAVWTKLVVGNNATIGGIYGQAIDLNNNGNLIFSTSTIGSVLSWDVQYYEQVYD